MDDNNSIFDEEENKSSDSTSESEKQEEKGISDGEPKDVFIKTSGLKEDEEETDEQRKKRIADRKEREKAPGKYSLDNPSSMDRIKKFTKSLLIYVSIAALVSIVFMYFIVKTKGNEIMKDDYPRITLTEFWEMVEEGKVEAIYADKTKYLDFDILLYNDETRAMSVGDRRNYEGHSKEDYYICMHPGTDEFREQVLLANVDYRHKTDETSATDKQDSALTDIVSVLVGIPSAVMTVIMIVFLFYMIRMVQKDVTSEISEVVTESKSKKRFEDVIGLDEIVDDVKFIVTLVKNPHKGESIGAKPPKGILFSGPPGTGKTLLAKAVAGEAGVPFIYLNASNLIELYVGMGARRVRDTFREARRKAPCVVFIDEIDAVGASRETVDSNSERKQTVNALLQELDGFKPSSGIVVIAATNTPEVLDKALTRSGRFDREVVVAPPKNWQAREKLFKFYTEVLSVDDDVNLEALAKETIGFTGADVEATCNEAAIIALSNDKQKISMSDFEEAIDKRILKGNKRKSEVSKDTTIIAYHEAGHAVMAFLNKKEIARATIVGSTSGVGGFVLHSEKEGAFTSKAEFIQNIMGAYAGRASEEIKFGPDSITTGASSDIQAATQTLMQYIINYGFDEDMGMVDYAFLVNHQMLDKEDLNLKLKELANKFYKDTVETLRANYNLVEKLATKLLEVETISGEEIQKLLEN